MVYILGMHIYINFFQSCSMFFDLFFLILSSFCHCHLWNFVGWIGVTWKAKGVNIWAMTVQNEPLNNASWEACFLVRGCTWVSAGFRQLWSGEESINLFCACVNAVVCSCVIYCNIRMFGMQNCTHPKCSKGWFSGHVGLSFVGGEMELPARESKGSFDVTSLDLSWAFP